MNNKTVTMSRELALLKEASEWIKANSFGGTDAIDLWERIDAQLESVNGVTTDEYLIEIAKQSAAVCSEQHSYMDRALYLDWQPHKWVIDAMRKVAAPAVERQEPVAWALDVEGYKTVIIDNYQRALSEQEHFQGRGRTAVIRSLYTSPPAPVSVVRYSWDDIVDMVSEVIGCEYSRDPNTFIGHQMTGINFNSLARIIDKVKELNQ